MIKLLAILLLVYIAWVALGCAAQRQFIYPRRFVQPDANPGEGVAGLEKIMMPTDAGPVEAWVLPGDGVSDDHPGAAVIFAHGNAELIEYWPDTLDRFRKLGVTVMLCEYRGYGRSAGSPSQDAIVGDYARFYERLASRGDVDPGRIVFMGRSLGTGVVCQLALRHKPAAMILQSPFTSVASIMAGYGIPRAFCLDPYDNDEALAKLDVPVLILHGSRDTIVPVTHGRKLHEIAKGSKLIEYDFGHNDFPVDSDRYWADLAAFLRERKIIKSDAGS